MEGTDLEVCAKLLGKEQRRVVFVLCATTRRTIDGFNLPDLLSFPISNTVVFL